MATADGERIEVGGFHDVRGVVRVDKDSARDDCAHAIAISAFAASDLPIEYHDVTFGVVALVLILRRCERDLAQ